MRWKNKDQGSNPTLTNLVFFFIFFFQNQPLTRMDSWLYLTPNLSNILIGLITKSSELDVLYYQVFKLTCQSLIWQLHFGYASMQKAAHHPIKFVNENIIMIIF